VLPSLPSVSICTLTYNRPTRLKQLLSCIENQDYPLNKVEWLVLDDSDSYSGNLTLRSKTDLRIKYQRINRKLILGEKRNLSHCLCDGEVIVYMDDDDFYFPTRISHAVKTLEKSGLELAGSTVLPIYFEHDQQLWISGPFGQNHATANTFAMTRKFARTNRYDNESSCNEEKEFLDNYTKAMAQLNPWETIVCISHETNTFDKKKMRSRGEHQRLKKADTKLTSLVRSKLEQSGHWASSRLIAQKQNTALKERREQIKEAGIQNNSDKVTHHHYERFYARALSFIPAKPNILEIGYGNGESIGLWKNLYPQSQITILDKDHEAKNLNYNCIKCDQSQHAELARAINSLDDREFDLIIDDGSHFPAHQIETFVFLFPFLKEGGTYIIEDTETSYWEKGELYGYVYCTKQKQNCVDFFKSHVETVNKEFSPEESRTTTEDDADKDPTYRNMIESITFGHNCIIVHKCFAEDTEISQRSYRFKKNLDS